MIPQKRPGDWTLEDRSHHYSGNLDFLGTPPANDASQSSQPPTLNPNAFEGFRLDCELYGNDETSLNEGSFNLESEVYWPVVPAEDWYHQAYQQPIDQYGVGWQDWEWNTYLNSNEGPVQDPPWFETSSEGHAEWLGAPSEQQDNCSTKEVSERKTCFGMIHNARVKVNDKASGFLNEEGAPLTTTGLYHFEIVFQTRSFILQSPLVGSVAVLNEQTGHTLKSVMELNCLSLGAYSSVDQWNNSGQNRTKSAKNAYMSVDINIYGPEDVRDAVGQILSLNHTYLQHPSYLDQGALYDNPHFLRIPGIAPDIAALDRASFEQDATMESEVSRISTRIQIDEAISAIFDSLTRFKCLEKLEADDRIKTPLLPHQKEALDFLAQREFGPVPENFSLWECSTDKGRDIYENKIDGSKSSKLPLETGGGILADDMGLGKTLTILAAISRTLEQAQIFVDETWIKLKQPCHNIGIPQVPSRSSLVIVPTPLLLEEWLREIHRHSDESLKVTIYHGRGRDVDPVLLADSDIVLSTYHTVATEAIDPESALFQVIWFRIVLDEAHIIRRMSTKLFRAAFKLSANFRWCLTGTPIQNRLEDIGSLLAFLRIAPFEDVFEFRRHIIAPIMNSTGRGTYNLRLLLDSVCLRRTKVLLDLPDLVDEYRKLDFSEEEKQLYDTTEKEMARAIKEQVMVEKSSKRYLGIFQLQLRLRRICNHGTFANASTRNSEAQNQLDPEEAITTLKETDATCVYCEFRVSKMAGTKATRRGYFTVCGHLLCSKCIPRFEADLKDSEQGSGLQCSLCPKQLAKQYLLQPGPRSKMGNKFSDTDGPNAADFNDSGISSKVSTMISDIEQNVHKGKSIVFSCWTRSLDLVEKLFAVRQIRYARLDGSHSTYQRQQVLDDFDSDPYLRVLIMTTGTGAVGLNLTMANFVYMLEPQWNPTVEEQAIARVLRLGQKANVKVVRYIMRSTIEEGMRTQQLRKLAIAKIGWDEKSDS